MHTLFLISYNQESNFCILVSSNSFALLLTNVVFFGRFALRSRSSIELSLIKFESKPKNSQIFVANSNLLKISSEDKCRFPQNSFPDNSFYSSLLLLKD